MNNLDFAKKIFADKKTFFVLSAVFIVGILLMVLPADDSDKNALDISEVQTQYNIHSDSYSSYDIEKELENILSSVDGLGETQVMVKYNSSSEKIPLTDKSSSSGKIIQNNSNGGTTPFISKEIYAQIEGVIIVAQGGDNKKIKSEIAVAVSELLGIPIHKVSILKMNNGGK